MVDDAFVRHVGLEHGSVPAGGATQWLPIFVGDRRAREIIYMCEEIPAAQAAEWGLVKWAVPAGELDAKTDAVVEKLAAKLPQTTRYAKQQLNFWRDLSWHETVNHARDWLPLSMLGEEAQEAVRAFTDRSGTGGDDRTWPSSGRKAKLCARTPCPAGTVPARPCRSWPGAVAGRGSQRQAGAPM